MTITKFDCFAAKKTETSPRCSALKAEYAHCNDCALYKTAEENRRQEAAAIERLVSLAKGATGWRR